MNKNKNKNNKLSTSQFTSIIFLIKKIKKITIINFNENVFNEVP